MKFIRFGPFWPGLDLNIWSMVMQDDYYVKAFFVSQSYKQQREATPLTAADPASKVFAVMPTCAGG